VNDCQMVICVFSSGAISSANEILTLSESIEESCLGHVGFAALQLLEKATFVACVEDFENGCEKGSVSDDHLCGRGRGLACHRARNVVVVGRPVCDPN